MSREYDLIVFGATGFTGQYVAEEVSRIAGEEHVSWAVAGRNAEKLETILANVERATGIVVINFYYFQWLILYIVLFLLYRQARERCWDNHS